MTGTQQPTTAGDRRPVVVYATPDPELTKAIEETVAQRGGQAVPAPTPTGFVQAVDYWFPVLALLETTLTPDDGGEWVAAVRRCKLRPHTRAVPITVIGDPAHDSTARLRKAGADHIAPRAEFINELDRHIHQAIAPPTRYPEGWDEPLSEKAAKGIEEFNRREFYEQHEWLEHAWMEETRPIRDLYQGILQVGVAFYHIEAGNWAGALKMFRRGLPRLRDLPPVCQGLDIDALRTTAEKIHREVTALGRKRLHEFDTRRLPTIRYAGLDSTGASSRRA